MVRRAQLNPLGLNWERFTVAVDGVQRIIGCVQLKPHGNASHREGSLPGGALELASLVVDRDWRRRGVATRLIEVTKANAGETLWLMCESRLVPFYERFDFHNGLQANDMPPYFRRIWRLVAVARFVMRREPGLSIMRWQAQDKSFQRVSDRTDTRTF